MSPIHIRAKEDDVAPVVLLVGDPGRATRAAERMEDASCYNEFRGLLGYTGRHRGVPISVQTTAMGCPSAAIVCEELAMLGAQVLIRLGTCGATRQEIKPTDLVIATSACPLDGTTRAYLKDDPFAPTASFRVVQELVKAAQAVGVTYHVGPIATEDALYAVGEGWTARWAARSILAQEMEASAIFTVAALRGMEAGCALTASNYASQHERLSDEQLLPAIDRMLEVGLEAAVALSS